MNQTVRRTVIYWIPVAIWMGFIFLLSSYAGATLERTQERPFGIVPSEIVLVATSEIVVHPVEFGVLAILVYRLLGSYSSIRWRYVLVGSLLFAIGYGLLDEFHQSFVPGRSSTLADVGLDALGALVGVLVAEMGIRLGKARTST